MNNSREKISDPRIPMRKEIFKYFDPRNIHDKKNRDPLNTHEK